MYRIIWKDKILTAKAGALLSDVLMQGGVPAEHPCGGKGTCRKCKVLVDGEAVLSCQYRIHKDITVCLPEKESILSETGAAETGRMTENCCFALDIGTTTLALALVSLDEGKIIKVITRTNPQRMYGADVMSRIGYCMENGVSRLQRELLREINDMLDTFALSHAVKLYAAGNTTMLHLFRGTDCSSMGAAPYTPVFLAEQCDTGEALGLHGISEVISLPSIAAFVGADLVAGMNCIGMPETGKYNFLVDLGTNAEIMLYNADGVLCTAAAAGPCFEGANISCGMSATEGAVYAFSLADGTPAIRTVGDAPPKGLCGTGLVDIIAALTESEVVDETGFMEDEEYNIADGVSLNQEDVRQYQLAKSAVYSAMMTLMKKKDITFCDIDRLYISGGFSARIDIGNAVKTGLLPSELQDKCTALNNSSLLGTVRYACEGNDLSVYLKNAVYADLAADPIFAALFVENMLFGVE